MLAATQHEIEHVTEYMKSQAPRSNGTIRSESLCGERVAHSSRHLGRAYRCRSLVGHYRADEPLFAGPISEHGSGAVFSRRPLLKNSAQRAASA